MLCKESSSMGSITHGETSLHNRREAEPTEGQTLYWSVTCFKLNVGVQRRSSVRAIKRCHY